jgi:spore coat protein A
MRMIESKLHRDLPPTRMWAYGGSFPGPTFETRSGQGLLIEWANELPDRHFLPIDHRLHGAEANQPEVRTVVHVHGAKVPSGSDGYPEDWYTSGKSATYYYPNEQDAAMLWYHDHAMGITRLNIYAGLAGAFFVRDSVEDALHLPQGQYEVPLIICDRFLRSDGQLDYPVSGQSEAPWVPEVFGNVMLVNGKAFPYLDVEPRAYRFRILNASNGRFYNLSLSNRQAFHQIGSDQGLLPAPAPIENLSLAPAERADVVVDFTNHAGEQIVLANETFELMQFRVGRAKPANSVRLPSVLRPVLRIPESSAVKTRILTLDELKNPAGETIGMLLNNTRWHMPVTEGPVLNTTEIWTIVNPTDDSHPIHLHLVRFQILDRRRYDSFRFQTTGQLRFTGPVEPPQLNEAGWKDTVQAHGGMVTRIIVRFEGYAGRYVWHCHVLEHEDNEMMRPYEVIAPERPA